MATLPLADRIRTYALDSLILPGLRDAPTVAVRAGDVHGALGLNNRAPAVCRALTAQTFHDRHGLRLISTAGPPEGFSTTFVFVDAAAEAERGNPPTLTPAHEDALAWFQARSGSVVPWAALRQGDPLKAVLPKGIYRPQGWRHALSVKVIPTGPYADELPERYEPGLVFRYHQEEVDGADPRFERSNLGLANCMRDRVPVGVLRQVRGGVGAQYEVVGVGRVLAWNAPYFSVELLEPLSGVETEAPGPVSTEDARRRAWRAIVARRGQARFRQTLIAAYEGRCAISGCDVEAVLEAAHVVPYLGDHTDVVTNGLLLRADLHTLFDLGKLRLDPRTRQVVLDPALRSSEYAPFHARQLREPAQPRDRPSAAVLAQAWEGS